MAANGETNIPSMEERSWKACTCLPGYEATTLGRAICELDAHEVQTFLKVRTLSIDELNSICHRTTIRNGQDLGDRPLDVYLTARSARTKSPTAWTTEEDAILVLLLQHGVAPATHTFTQLATVDLETRLTDIALEEHTNPKVLEELAKTGALRNYPDGHGHLREIIETLKPGHWQRAKFDVLQPRRPHGPAPQGSHSLKKADLSGKPVNIMCLCTCGAGPNGGVCAEECLKMLIVNAYARFQAVIWPTVTREVQWICECGRDYRLCCQDRGRLSGLVEAQIREAEKKTNWVPGAINLVLEHRGQFVGYHPEIVTLPLVLSPSALTPVAFTPVAFTPVALTPVALNPVALTPVAFEGPGEGGL